MIHWGKGPRGMSASERSGNSASWVLRSGVGYRAFSGLPTMTSSSGSHSLQLQTSDIDTTPPHRYCETWPIQDHLLTRCCALGVSCLRTSHRASLVPHHRTELLKK